jgi:hypothetical protein
MSWMKTHTLNENNLSSFQSTARRTRVISDSRDIESNNVRAHYEMSMSRPKGNFLFGPFFASFDIVCFTY